MVWALLARVWNVTSMFPFVLLFPPFILNDFDFVLYFVSSVMLGLRGAVAFALAMRNTESIPRQMMLTSVLIVVLVTVIVNGGATMSVLSFLKIRLDTQAVAFYS